MLLFGHVFDYHERGSLNLFGVKHTISVIVLSLFCVFKSG